MSGVTGVFDDRGTRQYAMSGYTGHQKGILDFDNPATLQEDKNGKIPGKQHRNHTKQLLGNLGDNLSNQEVWGICVANMESQQQFFEYHVDYIPQS